MLTWAGRLYPVKDRPDQEGEAQLEETLVTIRLLREDALGRSVPLCLWPHSLLSCHLVHSESGSSSVSEQARLPYDTQGLGPLGGSCFISRIFFSLAPL